jgi:pyruvate/2-oxoglutarate dehydrogenase complex dihydrolipoamide acyltransferase (E2) component
MAIDYVMPKLAMAMNEGTINEWFIQHGTKVEKGQILLDVETEKVSYECESPDTGYLCILEPQGGTVQVGTLIAKFCKSPEEAEVELTLSLNGPGDTQVEIVDKEKLGNRIGLNTESMGVLLSGNEEIPRKQMQSEMANRRIKSSPLARKIAREKGVNLSLVTGTGPDGRIIKVDVLKASANALTTNPTSIIGSVVRKRIPITGIRKVIGDRMRNSLKNTAQLSSSWESNITNLLAMRKELITHEEQLGTRVSVNAFIIKAMVHAIKKVPVVNSVIEDDAYVVYDNINMGIAISITGEDEFDARLTVGVLHNVEHMGLVDIDKEMKALIQRIKNGIATEKDTSGSTITLSTTAGIAPPGQSGTPILNHPNAAILGPSTPVEKPVVIDGVIAIQSMMPIGFTWDHCVFDGEPAMRFARALHDILENPTLLLV